MNIRKQIVGALGAIVLLGSSFVPALAATDDDRDASITIEAGVLSVSIDGGDFDEQNYSLEDETYEGSFTVTASDYTGSGSGWRVLINGDAEFTGATTGDTFGIDNLVLNSSASDDTAAGSDDVSTVSVAAETIMSATDKTLLTAAPGGGEGAYEFIFGGSELTVPGQTRADTYSATIFVDILGGNSAP